MNLELTRHNYRRVEPDAKEKCTNCKYGFFNGPLGLCKLFRDEDLDDRISAGHVCDEWVSNKTREKDK